jgi:hypothetical protein
MKIWASMPAAAAHAAIALAAFPADGMATLFIPNSRHIETAQESPRALNDAVGLSPSSFTQRSSAPIRAPSFWALNKGVQPSPSVKIEESEGGNTGA